MRAAGTDAIGVLRWGLRRYRAIVVVCLLLGTVLAPLAVLQRGTVVEAEALVIAQRLDMSLTALPRYGQAVFTNGEVARAVATKFGDLGGFEDVIPDRVSVVAEQDSIVFRVIGIDADPKTAAAIANTAAETFVQALNTAGAGVGTFALQSPAQPPTSQGGASGLLLAVPVGLVAGLLLGLAVVSVLLVIRRPVVDGPDAEEATGVPVLGTVTVPRTRGGVTAQPQEFVGLIPVCRRLLALPTPTLIMVSRPREERVRKQLSLALVSVLGGVRDIRFIGSSELQDVVAGRRAAAGSAQIQPPAADAPGADSLTLVDSSEPLDLVQPPHSTATVLVVPEGMGNTALRAAVVEHLGGSAEARLLLVRRGRASRGKPDPDGNRTEEPQRNEAALADKR